MGTHRQVSDDGRGKSAATPETTGGATTRSDRVLSSLPVLVALWLLVSAFVLPVPSPLVLAKDVVAAVILLAVVIAGTVSARARRLQPVTCVAVGILLLAAVVLLEFGPGSEPVIRQWNEVVLGVLLLCLGAARAR